MAIKVLLNTRLLMQRLGFLKVVCCLTNINTIIGQEKLSHNFYDLIGPCSKIKVDLGEKDENGELVYKNLIDYLTFYRLLVKYGMVNNKTENASIDIELQDILLSSKSLPSQTGSIYKMEMNDFTELALDLALIRKPTCNLTPGGHIVKNLFVSSKQRQLIEDFKSKKILANRYWYKEFLSDQKKDILLLEQNEKIFFLYKLIKFDGVALYFAYKKCMKQCLGEDDKYSTFRRHQNKFDPNNRWAGFGDLFGDRKKETDKFFAPNAGVFEDICKIYEKLYYDSNSRVMLNSLRKFGREVAANRKVLGKPINSNRSLEDIEEYDSEILEEGDFRTTIRHISNVRLEPFVDIGLLERVKNRESVTYEYKFKEPGIVFFTDFIEFMDKFVGEDIGKLSYKFEEGENLLVDEILKIKKSAYYLFQYAIDIFLRTRYFSLVNEVFGIHAEKISNDSELISILKSSEESVLGIFGYRSIEDLFLVSMFKEGKYLDIYDAEDLLKKSGKAILRTSETRFFPESIKLL